MAAHTNMFLLLSDENEDTTSGDDQQPVPAEPQQSDDATPDSDTPDAGAPQDLSPEARQERAEATRRKQMQAFLMTFHERVHGPEQPLDEGGIWGAVLTPRNKIDLPDPTDPLEPYTNARCRITPVPGSRASYENPNNIWMIPALPAKLGFPVKVTRWPFPERESDDTKYNFFVHSLFIGADVSDSSFNKYTHEGWIGVALVVRTDGKDLSDQQVDVLLHYINDEFGEAAASLDKMKKGKAKKETKKQIVEKYLCPEAFHAYFEEFRREKIADNRAWHDCISPVRVTMDEVGIVCGLCYSKKPAGDEFTPCTGGCNRFYCSEKCQNEDESRHMNICMKPELEDGGDSGGEDSTGIDSDDVYSHSNGSSSDLSKSEVSKSE